MKVTFCCNSRYALSRGQGRFDRIRKPLQACPGCAVRLAYPSGAMLEATGDRTLCKSRVSAEMARSRKISLASRPIFCAGERERLFCSIVSGSLAHYTMPGAFGLRHTYTHKRTAVSGNYQIEIECSVSASQCDRPPQARLSATLRDQEATFGDSRSNGQQ